MALYDAFISYSHAKDKPIAAALQSAVQKLGKPWYRRRALRIFRDDTSLSATPQLWPSIERALADSRFLILLASPEAAASHWVGKEVSYWLEHKGADTLLIALTDGTLVWDDASGDFGRHETGPLPAALRGRFPSEPKWEDMSAYRGGAAPRDAKFIDLAANFAAAIHGLPKEDLLSQEVRQQRRALMLAWSAAGSLFVIGGLAVWQWTLAAEQRNRAERTLATATRTTDTLVFDLAQAFRRRTGMPVDLVQLILKRVQELQTQLSEAGERTPELLRLQAVALDELYSTYVSLGDSKSALETAERGRAILESLLKAAPGNIQYQRDLAVAINNIGDARFATTAKWDEALAVYRQAMAIIEKLVTALPNSAIFQRDLSFCLNKIADMLLVGGHRDEALASYRRSLSITEMLAAKEPRRLDLQSDLAFTHNRIALLLSETGRVAAALDEYKAIVDIREKLVAADARNSTWQRDLFLGLSRMGDVLVTLARNAEALATFTRALSIIEALAATDLLNTQWQRDVSIAHDQIGDVRLSAREPQQALESYRKGFAIRENLVALHPESLLWQRDLEISHNKIGDALLASGKPADAVAAFEAGLAIAQKLAQVDPNNALWQGDLAACFGKIGEAVTASDRPRARAAFQNALAIRETLAERDPANLNWQRDLAVAYERVASLTYGDGDKEGALAIYRTALPVRKKLAAADPDNVQRQRDMATNLDRIGSILIELERKDEARDALREGLAIIERLAMAAPDSIQWQLDLVTVLFKLAYANDDPRARLEQARDIIRKLEADGKLSAAQKSWIELIDYSLANLPN